MNITLFDSVYHKELLPLTYTKPVASLRVGILTIQEKWEKYAKTKVAVRTQDYLAKKFNSNTDGARMGINASILPNKAIFGELEDLETEHILMKNGTVLAINPLPNSSENLDEILVNYKIVESQVGFLQVKNVWDIFALNDTEIRNDLELIKPFKTFVKPSETNQIIGNEVYIEEGAKVECAILNSTTGPIYVAKDAEIMEGSIIRGPLALCENGVIKMGAKIYGATTIGPFSKVGGEINNCVIQAYSNKGHDGFLGNSVLGEWCNLGADTNNSNLKNNYQSVDVYSYTEEKYVDTELQFCGLIMGDHSKSAINTMFNTGTIVGVSCNIYGADFPSKFIPSFSWGGRRPMIYKVEKALDTAKIVCARRDIEVTEEDVKIMEHIFEETSKYRK